MEQLVTAVTLRRVNLVSHCVCLQHIVATVDEKTQIQIIFFNQIREYCCSFNQQNHFNDNSCETSEVC